MRFFIYILSVLVLFIAPSDVKAQSISECLKISLEKPTGNFKTLNVGIRATNDCKDALYFSFVVCSNEEIFSHGGGITNLYKQDSARNLIVPKSTTYKWSQAGGFTYLKGSGDYNFQYKASYTPMGSLPRCKAPPSRSSTNSGSGDISKFLGNWVGATYNGQRKVFENRINIAESGGRIFLSVSNKDVDTGMVSNGRLRARIKGNKLIVKNFGGTWVYTVDGSTLVMSGRRFTGQFRRQ